tara:strand:- start:349 stop:768 length:420 start_codon:yes stop_codon:yes gene_type:complete
MLYRELDNQLTIETLQKLELRVKDRFPESGLLKVCNELLIVAEESKAKIAFISKPLLWLRLALISLVLVTFFILFLTISTLNEETGHFNMIDLISIAEASINDLILMAPPCIFWQKQKHESNGIVHWMLCMKFVQLPCD